MRVLVTGALGFTGLHMVSRLKEEPVTHVIGLDRNQSIPASLPLDDYVCGDLAEEGIALKAIRETAPDVVIHLAGGMKGAHSELWRANVAASLKLLGAVTRERPTTRVLLIGSAAEYGLVEPARLPVREVEICRPANTYGLTKYRVTRLAQMMVRRFGIRVVVARPFNLVGFRMPSTLVAGAVLERAIAAIAEGRDEVAVGTLTHSRDFVNVTDAVEIYWRLALVERWGETFNVCTGVARTVQSLLEELLSYAPRPLRLVHSAELTTSGDVSAVYGSPDKTQAVTGFRPSSNLSFALRDAWRLTARRSSGS